MYCAKRCLVLAMMAIAVTFVSVPANACKMMDGALIPSRAEVLARDRKEADMVVVGVPTPLSDIVAGNGDQWAAHATRYLLTVDYVEKGISMPSIDINEIVMSSCDLPLGKRHLAIAGKQRVYLHSEDGKWLLINSESMTPHPVGDEAASYDLQTREAAPANGTRP